MHFGEYELSPSLISLSPLPSTHPNPFQRKPVRSSIACHGNFNLVKGRSLGFASAPPDLSALLRLALASAHIPEGLNLAGQMQLVGSLSKRHAVEPKALRPLVDERFQGLLHSPVRGSFHLSFTVLVHYRSSGRI